MAEFQVFPYKEDRYPLNERLGRVTCWVRHVASGVPVAEFTDQAIAQQFVDALNGHETLLEAIQALNWQTKQQEYRASIESTRPKAQGTGWYGRASTDAWQPPSVVTDALNDIDERTKKLEEKAEGEGVQVEPNPIPNTRSSLQQSAEGSPESSAS